MLGGSQSVGPGAAVMVLTWVTGAIRLLIKKAATDKLQKINLQSTREHMMVGQHRLTQTLRNKQHYLKQTRVRGIRRNKTVTRRR